MKNARLPLLALVVFTGLTSVSWSPEDAGIGPVDPAVIQGHGTVVTPVMNEAIPTGKNVLWCATFQMAWDGACRKFGRPLQLQPKCKLADSLNQQTFDPSWVDAASVFTTEGRVNEEVLKRIDEGVRNKAGHTSKLVKELEKSSAPDDLVFYAMLHKELKFETPFGKLGNWKLGSRSVPWFGFTPEQKNTGKLRQQVKVHHHAAKNDFVIEILADKTGDQLLLAKLPSPPESPGAISKAVLARLKNDAPTAGGADLLAVPNVILEESAEFSELQGKKVAATPLILMKALQTIDFRMDEKGVKLDSEAAISFGCSAQHHVVPRLMVLTPPFALIMKRKDAPQPYFVAWFGNTDALRGK